MAGRNLQNTSSLESYAQSKERQRALREWIQDDWHRDECGGCKYTYHITLATHQEISMDRARHLLREWDARMNRAIVGREWRRRINQNNRWLAFAESKKSDPHWHLIFCLSQDLPRRRRGGLLGASKPQFIHRYTTKDGSLEVRRGLPGLVANTWSDVTRRMGTADTTLIYDLQGIAGYLTKEQYDAALYDRFVTSSEFKDEG